MNEPNREIQSLTIRDILVFGKRLTTVEERRQHFDFLSTVLLSLAAVLSALSAYQASRWYTDMNVSLSESSILRAEAALNDRQANRLMLTDMILFTEWTEQFSKKDSLMMLAVQDRFSESLKTAFISWMLVTDRGVAGLLPKGTPFDSDRYSNPLLDQSKTMTKQADEQFDIAKNAARTGDDFIFSVVIFSLALFFGAICTKIDRHSLQIFLWWMGALILLFGVVLIVRLPWNF